MELFDILNAFEPNKYRTQLVNLKESLLPGSIA